MKKLGKSSKKGFTLVELIVVIVILAVLAAMLVPALIGYIDRARKEKDYQTASTVYAAAQAALTEAYAKGDIEKKADANKIANDSTFNSVNYGDVVYDLAGVEKTKVTGFSFNATNAIITDGTVTIVNGGSASVTYELKSDGSWGVKTESNNGGNNGGNNDNGGDSGNDGN